MRFTTCSDGASPKSDWKMSGMKFDEGDYRTGQQSTMHISIIFKYAELISAGFLSGLLRRSGDGMLDLTRWG